MSFGPVTGMCIYSDTGSIILLPFGNILPSLLTAGTTSAYTVLCLYVVYRSLFSRPFLLSH